MGETNLFEALNQLNQLLLKMIHCFHRLRQNITKSQNMHKNTFYKPN